MGVQGCTLKWSGATLPNAEFFSMQNSNVTWYCNLIHNIDSGQPITRGEPKTSESEGREFACYILKIHSAT